MLDGVNHELLGRTGVVFNDLLASLSPVPREFYRSPKERRADPSPVFRSVVSRPTPEVAPDCVIRAVTTAIAQVRTLDDTSLETRCALAECSRQFVLPAVRIRVAPAFSLRG